MKIVLTIDGESDIIYLHNLIKNKIPDINLHSFRTIYNEINSPKIILLNSEDFYPKDLHKFVWNTSETHFKIQITHLLYDDNCILFLINIPNDVITYPPNKQNYILMAIGGKWMSYPEEMIHRKTTKTIDLESKLITAKVKIDP